VSYRNVQLWLSKASALITSLKIRSSEIDAVRVQGLSCLTPSITVNADCFVRLCREQARRPTINREDDFLHGEFRILGFAIMTSVWSKSRCPHVAVDWQAVNDLAKPMLVVDRPKIGVKRVAIQDKRRPLGLPAPKVIDV
jgi:hypothetical protein